MQRKSDVDLPHMMGRVGLLAMSGAGIYTDIDLIDRERLGGSVARGVASESSLERARSTSLLDNSVNAQRSSGVITLLRHLRTRLLHSENIKAAHCSQEASISHRKDPTLSAVTPVPFGGAFNAESSGVSYSSSAHTDRFCVKTVMVEGAYVFDHSFMQPVETTNRPSSSSSTTSMPSRCPKSYVSSIATLGDYVAVGDCGGNVVVMKQRPMSLIERKGIDDNMRGEEVEASDKYSSPELGGTRNPVMPTQTRDLYEFSAGKRVYDSMIDPLSSLEVTPDVTALAFLPQIGPAAYLLTSNEKIPKLFKVLQVHESAPRFRAVDSLDAKPIDPLMNASHNSTAVIKPVSQYAPVHEYNIHSLHPLSDVEQFITADELTMRLWCTEYPDTSIETFDMRPSCEGKPCEVVLRVRHFPHEPFLLFVATSAGFVQVLDIRQSLRWPNQTSQRFVNPPRFVDDSFKNLTNSISDCSLSPCGRYIAGRDFMTVCLWDVRAANPIDTAASISRHSSSAFRINDNNRDNDNFKIVRSWELYPGLYRKFGIISQTDFFHQKLDIHFMNPTQVGTGGLNRTVFMVDTSWITPDPGEAEPDHSVSSTGVKAFHLPAEKELKDLPKSIFPRRKFLDFSLPSSEHERDKPNTAFGSTESTHLDLESQVTRLSRPMISPEGTYSMLACCKEQVIQVSYNS